MKHTTPKPASWPVSPWPAVEERAGRWQTTIARRNPDLLHRAAAAGRPIRYMGTAPLFSGHVAYPGPKSDWIIGPAGPGPDLTVPRAVRMGLQALDDVGVRFPLIYIAHEVPKERLDLPAARLDIDDQAAAAAIGPVPPARSTVDVADRMARRSRTLLAVLGKALPVAGAIVAAPLLVAGAAVGAALAGLDPIVFGVIPAGPHTAGRPAAWYVLASWDWE